jgi:hypothetical protein
MTQKLASLDTKNMYTNIPTNKLIEIIKGTLNNNHVEEFIKHEIIELCQVILSQN